MPDSPYSVALSERAHAMIDHETICSCCKVPVPHSTTVEYSLYFGGSHGDGAPTYLCVECAITGDPKYKHISLIEVQAAVTGLIESVVDDKCRVREVELLRTRVAKLDGSRTCKTCDECGEILLSPRAWEMRSLAQYWCPVCKFADAQARVVELEDKLRGALKEYYDT